MAPTSGKNKRTFAGLLDSTVGGCLPTGQTPFECVVREAEEEASIPPEVTIKGVVAVGTVSYMDITDEKSEGEGNLLCPDTRFIYELELSQDLKPSLNDGEVEEFLLLSVNEMKEEMAKGKCTPGNALILIDFLVRRGIINYENEPDYLEIIPRLHRNQSLAISN